MSAWKLVSRAGLSRVAGKRHVMEHYSAKKQETEGLGREEKFSIQLEGGTFGH